MIWLDSLSLTSGPLNHRLRYRALCDMRTRVHAQLFRSPPLEEETLARCRAARQLDVMVRDSDSYLRLR